MAHLDKSNVGGFFSEALTADIETVLSNKTSLVGADSAGSQMLAAALNVSVTPLSHPDTHSILVQSGGTYQARAPFP